MTAPPPLFKPLAFFAAHSFVASIAANASAQTESSTWESLVKQSAQAVLEHADYHADPYPETTRQVRMSLEEGEASTQRVLEMEIFRKRSAQDPAKHQRTAIRFSQPNDLKGLALLVRDKNKIYVKLPGTPKVRRVASHARKQSFQGTDWSLDDINTVRLAPHYNAELVDSKDTYISLKLTRKPDADTPYPVLLAKVTKASLTIEEIDYLDENGTKIKNQKRSDLRTQKDGSKLYFDILMTDYNRNHATRLQVVSINTTPIPDRTFSKRWLIRNN